MHFISDVLIPKFAVNEKDIISKLSRWFTGAGDRNGGRKERYVQDRNRRERAEQINEQFFVTI